MKHQDTLLLEPRSARKLPKKPENESQKIRYWAKMAQHMEDSRINTYCPVVTNANLAERLVQELYDING